MSTLSIFVDESGDFGEYAKHSPYYIISMVFHDQKNSIQSEISKLEHELWELNYSNPAIHTEPLIRKEEDYRFMAPNQRRAILVKLYYFFLKSDAMYKSFVFEKRSYPDILKLEATIAKSIAGFIRENLQRFQTYSDIVLYYDNGQRELNRILNTVFATELSNYEVRKVFPHEYKLFQVADMLCTLELIRKKSKQGHLSRSEELIFHSRKDLQRDFLRRLKEKEWK